MYLFYMVSLIYYRTKHVYQEPWPEGKSLCMFFSWGQAVKRGEFFEIRGIRVPRLA